MTALPPPKALDTAPWSAVQVYRKLDRALYGYPERKLPEAHNAAVRFRQLVERGDYATIRDRILALGISGAVRRLARMDLP